MKSPFNLPSVDHLVEGRDYRIVDWSFADGAPVEKQKPEETVQPNQQNTPAPVSAPQSQPSQPQVSTPPAQPAAAQPPQQTGPCKPDEKMVFGVCRKTGGKNPQDEKDFDSAAKTDEEKNLEKEAKKQGSDVKNNKPVMIGDKKYGWAVKGGKPVLVEWNSVAGAKPAAPPAVKGASGGPQPLTAKAAKPAVMQPPAPAPKADSSAKIAELQQAMKVPGLPPAAQKTLQDAINKMGG